MTDPRIAAIPDIHGHAKGEHKPYAEERPIPYTARMLFLWFFHACQRGAPRFMMVSDHVNYLTFEDPAAVNLVRRALKLAAAGDLYGAAEAAGVDVAQAAVVSEGMRRGMRFSIGAEVDNDPRCRPDAQNIVDAMRPDGLIRSIHFLVIDHPTHGAGWQWPFDNPEFVELFDHVGVQKTWELYMVALLDAIKNLPGHIVGHFYVPTSFGHWPDERTLEKYEDQLIEACAARGLAIELNSRTLYRAIDENQKRRYREANLRLLKKAKIAGVAVAASADAHSPRDQGAMFDEVLALLDAAGINELVFPIGGRMARVALRATREHLEQLRGTVAPPVGSSITGFGRGELGQRAEVAARPANGTPTAKPAPSAKGRTTAKIAAAKGAIAPKAAAQVPAGAAKARTTPVRTTPARTTPARGKPTVVPAPLTEPKLRAARPAPKKTAATPARPVNARKPAAAARPAAKASPKRKPTGPSPSKLKAAQRKPKPAPKSKPKRAASPKRTQSKTAKGSVRKPLSRAKKRAAPAKRVAKKQSSVTRRAASKKAAPKKKGSKTRR